MFNTANLWIIFLIYNKKLIFMEIKKNNSRPWTAIPYINMLVYYLFFNKPCIQ